MRIFEELVHGWFSIIFCRVFIFKIPKIGIYGIWYDSPLTIPKTIPYITTSFPKFDCL
jgi:hypothetical protein